MRARKREDASVDLFPFLSVLACTIGALMLIALSFAGGKASNMPEVIYYEGTGQIPHLLLWEGNVVVVDGEAGQTRVAWSEAKTNNGKNDTPFGKMLQYVKENAATHYLFIIVKPSGFDTFDELSDLLDNRKLRFGYWPVAQDKVVSLKESR